MFRKRLGIAVVLVLGIGCANTLELPLKPIATWNAPNVDVEARVALAHAAVQAQYLQTGSEEALAWLLFYGIRSGMDRTKIEQILGEPLEGTDPPEGFTTPFGVQEQDEFYEVGPTQQGWFCLFHLRDGKLLKYHTLPPEPRERANALPLLTPLTPRDTVFRNPVPRILRAY